MRHGAHAGGNPRHFAVGKTPHDPGDCSGAERIEPVAVSLFYAFTFEIVKGEHVVHRR